MTIINDRLFDKQAFFSSLLFLLFLLLLVLLLLLLLLHFNKRPKIQVISKCTSASGSQQTIETEKLLQCHSEMTPCHRCEYTAAAAAAAALTAENAAVTTDKPIYILLVAYLHDFKLCSCDYFGDVTQCFDGRFFTFRCLK